VEDALKRDDTKYSLGSVLNHVCMHQTIVGLEAKAQLEKVDEYPDVVIGSLAVAVTSPGSHSRSPRISSTERHSNHRGGAVELPNANPGQYEYDCGDEAGLAPIVMMYTLGINSFLHRYTPVGSAITALLRSFPSRP